MAAYAGNPIGLLTVSGAKDHVPALPTMGASSFWPLFYMIGYDADRPPRWNYDISNFPLPGSHAGDLPDDTSSIVTAVLDPLDIEPNDTSVELSVDCVFQDRGKNGYGYFALIVEQLQGGSWAVASPITDVTLGEHDLYDSLFDQSPRPPAKTYYSTLTVSLSATQPVQQYRLTLYCDGDSSTASTVIHVSVTEGFTYIGNATLSFVPLTIVYAPPGVDSTNSVRQTDTFGTRFRFASDEARSAQVSAGFKFDLFGLFGVNFGGSSSDGIDLQESSGLQFSHFRTSTVTADNRYSNLSPEDWGPLGDLFVLLVNPAFALSRQPSQPDSLFYSLDSIDQIIVVSVAQLLRPGTDPVASAISAQDRQALLELDPFVTNLTPFFPDSGAPLVTAVDSYADPTANGRAEALMRIWLGPGSEYSYGNGESIELTTTSGATLSHNTSVKLGVSAGINVDDVAISLGADAENKVSTSYSNSFESTNARATNASALLIWPSTEDSGEGVEIFFDKIFSSLMFRRIRTSRRGAPGRVKSLPGTGALIGKVAAQTGRAHSGIAVTLRSDDSDRSVATTSTGDGTFEFFNLTRGRYRLNAGDTERTVTIGADSDALAPTRIDLTRVRRPVSVLESAAWEICAALRLSLAQLGRLRRAGGSIHTYDELVAVVQPTRDQREAWRRDVVLEWPKARRRKGSTTNQRRSSRDKTGA